MHYLAIIIVILNIATQLYVVWHNYRAAALDEKEVEPALNWACLVSLVYLAYFYFGL